MTLLRRLADAAATACRRLVRRRDTRPRMGARMGCEVGPCGQEAATSFYSEQEGREVRFCLDHGARFLWANANRENARTWERERR